MHVLLRLQNKGYRNHKKWWIVAVPKNTKLNGKILEKVGSWLPNNGKIYQRSISFNKDRIQYWLAHGAQCTEKVQKFLSIVDLMPPPVIKLGSKTLYERQEEVENKQKLRNPYHLSAQLDRFLNKILEQERNSYYFRKVMLMNEMQKELFLKNKNDQLEFSDNQYDFQREIDRLKNQLKDLNSKTEELDSQRQEIIVNRINKLFSIWRKQNEKLEFQNFMIESDEKKYKGYELTGEVLKSKIEIEMMVEKEKEIEERNKDFQYMLQPISRDEFYQYLVQNGKMTDAKAELISRQAYRSQKDNGFNVTRQHAYDACQLWKDKKIVNNYQLYNTKNYIDDNIFIPITKPVAPLPNQHEYNPEDYYEIPKMFDAIDNKNRPYSLPNVTDVYLPKKPLHNQPQWNLTEGKKNKPRSKPNPRGGRSYDFSKFKKEFCTIKPSTLFKYAYISQYEYQINQLQDLLK